MSSQPTSFRFPFKLPDSTEPVLAGAVRYAFSGIKDLNDAITALNGKVKANTASVTNVTQTVNTMVSGGGTFPIFGNVNLQPNQTPGAYTVVQRDLGGLILVNSSVPFALTLNSGLTTPFFVTVYNFGAGTVTATPSAQLVNNVASVTVTTGQFGIFYFDGTNWWEAFSILAQTITATTSKWLNSYNAATGLFTATQPAASDLSNGTTGTGKVVLATAPTLASVVSITGLSIFANNAAAIAGGLVAGNLYRTGADPDLIAVVH